MADPDGPCPETSGLPHPDIDALAASDQRSLMQAWGFIKQRQNGSSPLGLPKDGAVRAVVSLSRIAMLRAHWDGSADEPLRYIDIRAGGPAWSKRHFDALFGAMERAMLEMRAILKDERNEMVESGVRTRVSGSHESKKRRASSGPKAASEEVPEGKPVDRWGHKDAEHPSGAERL